MMKNKNNVVIAAAGSGKTTNVVNYAIRSNEKIIIVTYTEENYNEIRRKFYNVIGYIPENVKIQTWYSFLIKEFIRPYQSVKWEGKIRGVHLVNGSSKNRAKENEFEKFYINKSHKIYSDKISKLAYQMEVESEGKVVKRFCNIYDCLFIDEMQDLCGYDLSVLELLFSSKIKVTLVGDPRQTVYKTHHEKKYSQYLNRIEDFFRDKSKKYNISIDSITLNKTYRNQSEICEWSNKLFPHLQKCISVNKKITGHDGVFLVEESNVDEYLEKYNPMQLRYDRRKKVNDKYDSINMGLSKGRSFDRVLLYPANTMLCWFKDDSADLSYETRCKLYVALTRARYSVGIVVKKKELECISENNKGKIRIYKQDEVANVV